jgi:hypothetical protein
MLDVLFYLLFILLISSYYHLDVSLFEKIEDYEEKTLSSSKREAWQVTLDHFISIFFLSRIHKPHALIGYLSLHTLGLIFYG